jgi:hypothetical protein
MFVEQWYREYQNTNKEVFSDSFQKVREEESLEEILWSVALATTATGHSEVVGVKVINDEMQVPHLHTIEESRLSLAQITLKLKAPEEGSSKIVEKEVTIEILLPKLIDKYFFYLDGSRYFTILQMIDAGVYPVRAGVIGLKTLLMPFTISRHKEKYECTTGDEVELTYHSIRAFRKEIPVILYYLSILGFNETLKFLAADTHIRFERQGTEYTPDEIGFNVGKNLLMVVKKDFLAKEQWVIGNLLNALIEAKPSLEDVSKVEFWNLQLGKQFTTGSDAALRKAAKVSVSFQRILDRSTKNNLAKIPERDKENIFTLTRWMCAKFDTLNAIDSIDIRNKRIRLWEYVLYPIIKKMSAETYRVINCRAVTIKTMESAYGNIKKNICIKDLITSELLRYSTVVNTLDLFGAALNGTQGGPQGLSSDSVPARLRGIHPSYKGVIGFSKASAGDPGISFGFTPFFKTDGLFFDKTTYEGTDPEVFPANVETEVSEILTF